MSDYKAFKVEVEDKVAHVLINRPDKINSMNADFWREITEIFHWADRTVSGQWSFPERASTFLPVWT